MKPIVYRDKPAILVVVLFSVIWSGAVIAGTLSGDVSAASLGALLLPASLIWLVWRPSVAVMEDRVVLQRIFRRVECSYSDIRWIQESRRFGGRRGWRLDSMSGRNEFPIPLMGLFELGMDEVVSAIQEAGSLAGHPVQLRTQT